MSRRDNAAFRCARCCLHESLCVCSLIPRIETRTRIVLVTHRSEHRKPTNTGRLATECLANSAVLVRGHAGKPSEPLTSTPDRQTLLLFPHEDALPLADYAARGKPVTLVVPDGNWRQAFKVRKRVLGIAELPCVALPPGPPSMYRLRTETRAAGLSTFEAIARALGILDGAAVQEALEDVFVAMVERTLWARGSIASTSVTGGIPAGAKRHDPRSAHRFASVEDVVRAGVEAIATLEQKRAAIQAALDEGEASGVFDGEAFASVRSELGSARR